MAASEDDDRCCYRNLVQKVVGGYKITDEYALLKLWDFDWLYTPDGSLAPPELWSNFTAAAKERGVKKCMIDISQNGGG